MSNLSLDVHNVKHVVLDDMVCSSSTAWRSIHITDTDDNTFTITVYAQRDSKSIPIMLGSQDDE